MGFEKWLYRNGPGSPGHTARTLVKWYNNFKTGILSGSYDHEVYMAIYLERLSWQQKLGNQNCLLSPFAVNIDEIIAEKDMPLFVFAIECLETKQFRFGICDKNIEIILDVIREEVEKTGINLISLNNNTYKNKAITFLNEVLEYSRQNT